MELLEVPEEVVEDQQVPGGVYQPGVDVFFGEGADTEERPSRAEPPPHIAPRLAERLVQSRLADLFLPIGKRLQQRHAGRSPSFSLSPRGESRDIPNSRWPTGYAQSPSDMLCPA